MDDSEQAAAQRKPLAAVVTPPQRLPGFPGAYRVTPKTPRGDGKLRVRWKDDDGNIYEWDYQHGTVERYDRRGNHIGEYDHKTGRQIGQARKDRKVTP